MPWSGHGVTRRGRGGGQVEGLITEQREEMAALEEAVRELTRAVRELQRPAAAAPDKLLRPTGSDSEAASAEEKVCVCVCVCARARACGGSRCAP